MLELYSQEMKIISCLKYFYEKDGLFYKDNGNLSDTL